MNTEKVKSLLAQMGERMEKEKEYLTDLDNAIADGDHGINMARGFAAANEKIAAMPESDVGSLLKSFGMALVSAVGGSAGPLYGTAFMRVGMSFGAKTEIGIADFIPAFASAIEGVMMRGKATAGEKTMLDAMIPALDSMKKALEQGSEAPAVLQSGVNAAWQGVAYTETIAATKGRASYIGERSIGHKDPGAVSVTYILEEIKKSI